MAAAEEAVRIDGPRMGFRYMKQNLNNAEDWAFEAALDADFVLAGVNLAATIDKTVAPHGCDLFASAAHAAYGLLAGSVTPDC